MHSCFVGANLLCKSYHRLYSVLLACVHTGSPKFKTALSKTHLKACCRAEFLGILFLKSGSENWIKTWFRNKVYHVCNIYRNTCMYKHISFFLKLFSLIYQKYFHFLFSIPKEIRAELISVFAHRVILYLHKPIPITFENRTFAIFIPFYESYKLLDGSLCYSIGGIFLCKILCIFVSFSFQKA